MSAYEPMPIEEMKAKMRRNSQRYWYETGARHALSDVLEIDDEQREALVQKQLATFDASTTAVEKATAVATDPAIASMKALTAALKGGGR